MILERFSTYRYSHLNSDTMLRKYLQLGFVIWNKSVEFLFISVPFDTV